MVFSMFKVMEAREAMAMAMAMIYYSVSQLVTVSARSGRIMGLAMDTLVRWFSSTPILAVSMSSSFPVGCMEVASGDLFFTWRGQC